ncbi:hypothetical protein [Caballeronia sp. 15711]|jgi:hypothetical protein|uniref:hypothetical protein n=1 Tax=Caballeronia sp. 15711 TaxID=3391029 RepID=UPI0039E55AE1
MKTMTTAANQAAAGRHRRQYSAAAPECIEQLAADSIQPKAKNFRIHTPSAPWLRSGDSSTAANPIQSNIAAKLQPD